MKSLAQKRAELYGENNSNKVFLYTSADAGYKGIIEVTERTNTRYEKQSHAGFYMFLVGLVSVGGWAASVILSH